MTQTVEERCRLLVDGAKDYAMILLDPDGRVVIWNAGAERILGWTEDEVLGLPFDLIFTPEDREAGVASQEMTRAATEGRAMDLRWHMKKDGSRFWADGILEGLRDGQKNLRGFSKILRDATEKKLADEQHRRTQAELREALQRTAGILESITDAFYVLDREWRFTYLNDQAERLVSRRREDLLGKSVWDEFPESVGTTFDRQCRRAVADQAPVSVEEFYPPLGSWFEIRAYPSPDGLSVYFHDIGVRKALEGEQTRLAEANRLLLESTGEGIYGTDAEGCFTFVNRAAARMLGYTPEELIGRGGHDLVHHTRPDGAAYPAWECPILQTIQTGGSVRVEDDVFWRKDGTPFAVSFSAAAIREGSAVMGAVVTFDDIGARKALESERERLLTAAQARAEREALINRVGQAIRATSDPEEIQQFAARALGETLRADRCYFSFYDLAADSNWIGQDFRREDLPSLAGHYRLSDFQVNPEDYYPDGRTLVVADATADDWSFPEVLLTALRQLRVRSAIGIPIFDGGRLVATVSVAMADEPRAWTDDEVAVAEAVAALTRSAVETARLLAKQQARLQEEALVGRIGVAIRSEIDPEVIQATAAELLGEALKADRCFYLTYDLLGDAATVGRDYHRPDLTSLAGEYRLSDFEEMLAQVFTGGRAASIPDVRTSLSPAIGQALEASQNRAVLAVPFFDEGRLVAALWASTDRPRVWTAQEGALIEQAATLTRTALEAARVSRKERAIAQQLQDALQPAVPNYIQGLSVGSFTRPALEEASVGGDFFDVFPLDKELYALVIGDVSGKGLAAAQQLALIRNSLRTTLYLSRAPAQAAASLNAIVTAHDLLVGFVTAWVGVYDAHTGEISYCSCGHEPGLIHRAGTGQVEALETTGTPLGVAGNAAYGQGTFTLAEGDTLLLYTDGLSEAGPSRRELLSTEGLSQYLAALPTDTTEQAQAEALVGMVSAYANGIFRDDVAVLLARRRTKQ